MYDIPHPAGANRASSSREPFPYTFESRCPPKIPYSTAAKVSLRRTP